MIDHVLWPDDFHDGSKALLSKFLRRFTAEDDVDVCDKRTEPHVHNSLCQQDHQISSIVLFSLASTGRLGIASFVKGNSCSLLPASRASVFRGFKSFALQHPVLHFCFAHENIIHRHSEPLVSDVTVSSLLHCHPASANVVILLR